MTVTNVTYSETKPVPRFSIGGGNQVIREYDLDYIVETDDELDGPLSIITEAITFAGPVSLPDIGDAYEWQGEQDLLAFADSIGPMEEIDQCSYKIPVHFTSELPDSRRRDDGTPADSPEDIARVIDINFIEDEIPGTDWIFKGFCDGTGRHLVVRDAMDAPILDIDGNEQELLIGPVLSVGDVGPVRNSAGCPIKRNIKRFRHILRVTDYHSAWDCSWQSKLGFWNDDDVRLVELDAFAIKFDCTYPKRTLMLVNINKSNRRQNGFLYYGVTWVLAYDPDGWEHKELDAGVQAAFVPGAVDPSLGKVSPTGGFKLIDPADERLARAPTGKRDILDASGNPVTSEVLLNGEGVEAFIPNSGGIPAPIYSRWCRDNETAFATLPI